VSASYHSTVCQKCSEVCHDHCGLQEISTTGSNVFKGCAAMSGDYCHVCTGRCSYTYHYHARVTMKITSQTLDEVLHDVKAKYDQATKGATSQNNKINSVASAQKAVQDAIKQCTNSIKKQCYDLKKICRGFNLTDELYTLIEQLKFESRTLHSVAARKSAEEFIRSLETICEELKSQNL